MPRVIAVELFECEHCGSRHPDLQTATNCEINHDIIYMPIPREDIKRLWAFVVTGNPEHITDRIQKLLRKYNSVRGG